MSDITEFFRGGLDTRGRSLQDMISWSDLQLEQVHDWVQWAFPLREPSAFNPSAPLLTEADMEEFAANPEMRSSVEKVTNRFMEFLHLEDPVPHWVTSRNHNLLRITRVIRSVSMTSGLFLSRKVYDSVMNVYERENNRMIIGEKTSDFWKGAVLSTFGA